MSSPTPGAANDGAHQSADHILTRTPSAIPWEPETAVEDMASLKATVRFSIPEARQFDP